jgi:hypothetical protein
VSCRSVPPSHAAWPPPLLAAALALPSTGGRARADGPGAAPAIRGVEVVGAAFRVTLADGRALADDELVGAVLTAADEAGRPLVVRVDGHERDARDPSGETVLYALSTPDPATGAWGPLCDPDPDGRRLGFPLAGGWSPTGEHLHAEGFSVICTGGAIGKCVRFGYRPWRAGPDGRPLWDLHQACVRMVRADYCGDGVGRTRDGTPIDVYDRLGIQRDEPAPGMGFEAAWTPSGASCVRKVRIRGEVSLDGLERTCPARLAGRTGEACTEEGAARAPEVLLFNKSF